MNAQLQLQLEEVLRRFQAETGTLHLLEDEVLSLQAHVGIPAEVVRRVERVPVGKGMAGLAAQRNAPVSSCNLQTDGTGDVQPGARSTAVQGALVVPMRDRSGRVRGTLGIGLYRAYDYSQEETDRLLAIAARLAEPMEPAPAEAAE